MTTFYWIAGLAPIAAFLLGWTVGFGQAKKGDARQIGRLESEAEERNVEIATLRHQVAALSAADMSDDEFNRMLDILAHSGTRAGNGLPSADG